MFVVDSCTLLGLGVRVVVFRVCLILAAGCRLGLLVGLATCCIWVCFALLLLGDLLVVTICVCLTIQLCLLGCFWLIWLVMLVGFG